MLQRARRLWNSCCQMRRLTKFAVLVTCMSPVVLYLTSVSQSLVSDGRNLYCVISWSIPLYGTVHMPHWSWWVFTRIWVTCLLVPPALGITVGVRGLVSRMNPESTSRYTC
jgi:hypothetical protein